MAISFDLKPEELKGILNAVEVGDIDGNEAYEQIMLFQSKNRFEDSDMYIPSD